MARSSRPQPAEFRRKIAELFKSGRSIKSIADEYGMARRTVSSYVKQYDVDEGAREGLTTSERDELLRLRRENKRLKLEAEILSKATAWFAREADTIPNKRSDS